MNPQTQPSFGEERTQEMPAQECSAAAGEYLAVLSAEQVYAQRLVEKPLDGCVPSPILIP